MICSWMYFATPVLKSVMVDPLGVDDTSFHLVVSSPSTPTGPRAWIREVLMPTSAPRPKRKPSAKRVDALEKTQAESTELLNSAREASLSERMASVWPLPCAWMWETAAVGEFFFFFFFRMKERDERKKEKGRRE